MTFQSCYKSQNDLILHSFLFTWNLLNRATKAMLQSLVLMKPLLHCEQAGLKIAYIKPTSSSKPHAQHYLSGLCSFRQSTWTSLCPLSLAHTRTTLCTLWRGISWNTRPSIPRQPPSLAIVVEKLSTPGASGGLVGFLMAWAYQPSGAGADSFIYLICQVGGAL